MLLFTKFIKLWLKKEKVFILTEIENLDFLQLNM